MGPSQSFFQLLRDTEALKLFLKILLIILKVGEFFHFLNRLRNIKVN